MPPYSNAFVGITAANFTDPDGRHLQGSNFLLADGHVKWFKAGAVSSGGDAAGNSAASNQASDPNYFRAAGTSGNIGSTPAAATFSRY